MSDEIRVGDVALDLTQGRPVHIVEDTEQTVAEWSGDNDYDLEANYGNSRLGTGPNERVYDVVYCSSAKSEPSKTYAMPASRLLRIETEAADDGRPVADRIARDVLERLMGCAAMLDGGPDADDIEMLARYEAFDADLVTAARECVDVEQTISAEGDDA